MEMKEVISLVDLAERFAKAKGMVDSGYHWQRKAPGRSANKDQEVGNSLAVMKAIRAFNTTNSKAIKVYNASGYDGTARPDLRCRGSEGSAPEQSGRSPCRG